MESAKNNTVKSGSLSSRLLVRLAGQHCGLLLLLLLGLAGMAFPLPLQAQSYEAGYNFYVKGDFPGAEKAFGAALMRGPSHSDKARIYKMLGISQYMQGKRVEAEESFSQAKALNPKIRISPSEVLDETVIGFFNSVTPPPRYFSDEAARPSEPEPAKNDLPEPAAPAPTYLQVSSNVPDAHVYVDGRFMGGVGQLIPLEPGLREISVTAKGYTNLTQSLNLQPQRTNRLQVEFRAKPVVKTPVASEVNEPSAKEKLASEEAAKADAAAKAKRLRKDKPARRPDASATAAAKKNVKKKKRRAGERTEPATAYPTTYALLPFGGYQYLNNRWLLGGAFTALQAGGLVWFYTNWSEANKQVESTNTYIQQRDAESARIITETERNLHYNATLTEVQARNARIASLRSNRDIGMIIFGAAWGLSIIEGIVNQPTDAAPRARQANAPLPASQLASSATRFPARNESAFSWHIQPAFYSSHPVSPSGFVMDFRLNF